MCKLFLHYGQKIDDNDHIKYKSLTKFKSILNTLTKKEYLCVGLLRNQFLRHNKENF